MEKIIKLIEEIKSYKTNDELELIDQQTMLEFLYSYKAKAFDRANNIAHFTASAIVVNTNKTKVLFAYHLIYKTFAWRGGHADGNPDLYQVALKEAKEESGLNNLKPFNDKIMSLEVLPVMAHLKKGNIVPNHLHLNVTYVLIANEEDTLKIKEDENSALAWLEINDLDKYVNEKDMIKIYQKILNRIGKN